MGGALSGLVALTSPKRVASLTLISSMGFGEEINSAYINGFLKAKRPREYEAVLQKLFFHPRYVNRQMIDDIIRMKRIDGITSALQNIAQAAFPNGHQPPLDFSQSLPRTGVPIQLIWGTEDAIVPLRHASGAGLPLAVVQEAGHMPHVEQPAEVVARIRTFIAREV
jgi:pyruvate dehydrogenase E2 component (dihydrolipoamide acetyltransferase)